MPYLSARCARPDPQCIDVEYSKESEEKFYDLPLDVSGSGDLRKALDR